MFINRGLFGFESYNGNLFAFGGALMKSSAFRDHIDEYDPQVNFLEKAAF